MDDRVDLADVGQEAVAQPLALVRPADQAGDVVEVDRVVHDVRRADRPRDLLDALVELGVRAPFLNCTLDGRQAADVKRRMREGDLDLLYVAPERLVTDRFLALLDRSAAASTFAAALKLARQGRVVLAKGDGGFRDVTVSGVEDASMAAESVAGR